MNFGEKIKKLRADNNLSQEELAQKLCVTRTAVSKWETNKGFPSIDSFKLISQLFNVSIDDLISDDDIKSKKLLDEKRAKRFYIAAIGLLAVSVLSTLVSYFSKIKYIGIISLLAVVGYVVCAFYAKPRYKRIDAKKYIVPYIISRVFILLFVIGLMISMIIKMS